MMMRYTLAIFLTLFSLHVWAEEINLEAFELSEAPINRSDMDSIKRGAKTFATTCMSCHTLIYLRYDKVAKDAGITLDKMPINVTTWPLGVKPPDLSLETSVRGVNWVYTYLHSFYQDSSRPTGVNNLLVPGTAMPAILAPYQGNQVLTKDRVSGVYSASVHWYDLLTPTQEGSLKADEFDAMVGDIVNFLAYAAEPYYDEQHRLGWWVLGFLVVLFAMMYMLKKEYWKDVDDHKQD